MRRQGLFLRLLPHLAAFVVIALCVRLALWQSDRGQFKQDLLDDWADAPAVELDGSPQMPDRYARVRAQGQFDADRQILLDNQVRNMHSGVHVFTPFTPQGSSRIWLVNRGWQPFDRRSGHPPEYSTSAEPLVITGRTSDPPRVGLQIGSADALDAENWPNLMTYFDLDRIRDALGEEVAPQVILLDPDHPSHLTGDEWRPVTFGPDRHRAYAFQWSAIALAVFLIWLILTVRSLRSS